MEFGGEEEREKEVNKKRILIVRCRGTLLFGKSRSFGKFLNLPFFPQS